MKLADRVEALRRVPYFEGLPKKSLESIARAATVVDAPAGQMLIEAKTPASGMFIVADGTVRVDARREHWTLGPGEVVGELALFTHDSLRLARVRADGDVRLLAISRADFRELMLADSRLCIAILEIMAARLAAHLE